MGKQISLNLNKGRHGGRRTGAGRKRRHSKGVAHRVREKVSYRTPLHVNFKYRTLIRNKFCLKLLKRAILNARKHGLRVVHFSLQANHVHLIIEAENKKLLATGMRSITVTFAKGLKQRRVQIDRYHLHVLRSLRETKNAVQYVLFNQQKYEKGRYSVLDGYSSILNLGIWKNLVKNYCVKSKMTIRIGAEELWNPDHPISYFLKKA